MILSKMQTLQFWALHTSMNVSGAVANARRDCRSENSAEGDVLFNITAFDLAGNSFTVDQTAVVLTKCHYRSAQIHS